MESIDLRSSLFYSVMHHMSVVTYQSFGELLVQFSRTKKSKKNARQQMDPSLCKGVVWAVTKLTQNTNKWWAFVNMIMKHGFHKMQEMSLTS
jgi:hypothetical protein